MKTTNFKHPWRAMGQAVSNRWVAGAAFVSALMLSSTHLAALPTVTTISGGPTFGYVDGPSLQTAYYHTPVALALDHFAGALFVADRDNNAIRELNLSADVTFTFATY